MKAIKFAGNEPWQKQFASAVRHNVNNYFRENGISTKGNFTLVTQTIANLAMYIVPFVLLLLVPINPWLALPLVIVMGIGMAGIGMCVMHDGVHGSFSASDRLNKIMGGTMYLLGSNVFNWRLQHNILHHAYTNVQGFDEDIAAKGPIRLSEYTPLKKIHRFQHIHAFFFYGLMTIAKLVGDFRQLANYNREGMTKNHGVSPRWEYVKMVIVKMLYLSTFIGLPLLFTGYTWWQILLGFFIMHWTAGCILSTIFQMAHVVEGAREFQPGPDGIIRTEWAIHELQTTSDFARGNGLLNWYIGGLNFQIEHHLFPNICHVHYRKIAPIVERTAHDFGLPYNLKPSFRSALGSHIRRLQQLGRPS